MRKGEIMMANCSIHGLQPYYIVSPDLLHREHEINQSIVLVDLVFNDRVEVTIAVSRSFADVHSILSDTVDFHNVVSNSTWYPELKSMCSECYRLREWK
jgi:hypothetical protein